MKAVLLITGLAATIGLSLLGVRLGDAMPQVAKGEGVLSVAFGDARETISRAMVEKANNYFHGGVEVDCDHRHDHESDCLDCLHGHDHDHDSVNEDHLAERMSSRRHHDDGEILAKNTRWDLWGWINARVRAPEVDQHLEDAKAVEMMPWFWAAVKADPHNVDAWTTAFYIASTAMHDEALSRRVLDEAKDKNPDSLEVLLAEGRFVYRKGAGDVEAAEKIFSTIRDKALSRSNNDPTQLPESDRWMYKFALNYLADIARKRVR